MPSKSTPIRSDNSDEIAAAVRTRREELQFTQTDLVDRLAKLGLSLSRSHFANMESARFPFQVDQLMALDAILALPLLDRDELWKSKPMRFGNATEIAENLTQGPDGLEPLDGSLTLTAPSHAAVITGQANIDAAIGQLLASASYYGGPGQIVISGFPTASEQPHIPPNVRGFLLECCKNNYDCRHLMVSNGEDPSALMKLAASLLACRNYLGLVEDRARTGMEFIAVASADKKRNKAILLLRREPHSPVEYAVNVSDPDQVRTLIDFGRDVAALAKPLVSHLSFSDSVAEEIAITEPELNLHRAMAERSSEGDWIISSTGWLPTAFVPPEIFERRVASRLREFTKDDISSFYMGRRAGELVDLHRRQHEDLLALYDKRVPIQILIARSYFGSFVTNGSHHGAEIPSTALPRWRRFEPTEVRYMLERLVEFMLVDDSSLQLRMTDSLDSQLKKSKWEARGGRHGYVVLQTPIRDGTTQAVGSARMVLQDEIAAIGFRGIFDRAWCRALSFEETRNELRSARDWL